MKPVLRNLGPAMAGLVFWSGLCAPCAGQVIVFGNNNYNQTEVPAGATDVIGVAAGDYHCLALRRDGSVIAWGNNRYGQTNVPPDLTNAVSVAAGSTHSLALRRDGTVALWGTVLHYPWGDPLPPDATNIVSLALGPGAQHVLALRADGTVLDSGSGPYPGLTNPPPSARGIVAVAASSFCGLALRADGSVIAWGDNRYGVTNVPAAATNVVAIAAGWHGCAALRADGTVVVWGSMYSPFPPTSLTNIVDVACSARELLALKSDGTVVTAMSGLPPDYPKNKVAGIGAGSYNGLLVEGSGAPVFAGLPVNRTVPCGSPAYFRLLAGGALPLSYQWTCNGTNLPGATNTVLTVTNVQPEWAGRVYALVASNALGMATSGPMSLQTTPFEAYLSSSTPTALVDQQVTLTASTIGQGPFTFQWQLYGTNLPSATNSTLTLASAQLADAGPYSVIISNEFGLMTNCLSLPVVPTIVTNALQSRLGFPGGTVTFSLGLSAIIPVAYQWQFNGVDLEGATSASLSLTNVQSDQVGAYRLIFTDAYESVTNDATLSLIPVAAWGEFGQQTLSPEFTNLLALAAGDFHWLGLKADGTVVGSGDGWAAAPSDLSNVIAVAAGNDYSLALEADGTLAAWGSNTHGQTNVPPGLSNVVAIAAGDFHALALKADGSIVAWGDNSYGQTNVPADLTNAVAIAAGECNSMALRPDGTVAAWGAGTDNSGGGFNFGQSIVPAGLSNVVQIATGGADDLALTADGSFVGWGSNSDGEDTPPAGLSNIVAIAAGYSHSVVLKADGTVTAWGYDYYGQAEPPAGLTNVVAVCARGFQSAALIGNGPPPAQVRLLNPERTSRGFSLSVPSQSGHVYRLEYKDSLPASGWTALPLVAGTGRMLTLTDPDSTASQRFYRVRQW